MKSTFITLAAFLLMFIACDNRTPYEKMLQRELDSGIRQDTLFLGYYLGMPKQEFFDHSWELNQRKIVRGDSFVRYRLKGYSNDATMIFYPDFKVGRIHRMPVEIQFDAWAIWNRELYSDIFTVEVLDNIREIYGSALIQAVYPGAGKSVWIEIDGNRRIAVYRHDDRKGRLEFLDLTSE